MRDSRLALLGFGHVGQAFARLLLLKAWLLRERHQLNLVVTTVITGRHGWVVNETGLQLSSLLSAPSFSGAAPPPAISSIPADVLIELTPVSPHDGQPALGWLREGADRLWLSTALAAGGGWGPAAPVRGDRRG